MKMKADYGYTNVERHQRKGYVPPNLATDAIIKFRNGNGEGIVLITRKNAPFGLALPGGFAEHGLSLEDNIRKEVKEETNLEFQLDHPEHPICVHSNPGRDPRAHVIAVTYSGTGHGYLQSGDDAKTAFIVPYEELPSLLGRKKFAFHDHERAIQEFLINEGYIKQITI